MENEKNLPAKLEKKEISIIGKQIASHEQTLTETVAVQALELVKPMISSVSDELTNSLGDNETMYVIRVSKKGSPATILMIDTSQDFTIQGAKANFTSANIAKDKFIKRMKEEGHLSDEEYQSMKVCDNKFVLRGNIDKDTKKPTYIKKFYVIREFVDMLLTGRMKDLTEKLMQ